VDFVVELVDSIFHLANNEQVISFAEEFEEIRIVLVALVNPMALTSIQLPILTIFFNEF